MTGEDPADDPEFADALSEALDSLGESYPDADLSDEEPTLRVLTGVLTAAAPGSELRTDVARLLGMLAEQFPTELASVAPTIADELPKAGGRKHLLRALGYVSKADPGAVDDWIGTVVAALDDDDPAVVRTALWVVSNAAEADREVLSDSFLDLIDLLAHDDEEVQRRAAGALGSAPETTLVGEPDVLDRLLEQLESASHYRTAGRTLVSVAPAYGDRLVDSLFERIENGPPGAREHATWALVPLSDEHPDLVRPRWPELVELVREDDDYQVKNCAAASLAAIVRERPADEPLSALIDLLDHQDEFTRRYGCLALGDVAVATGQPSAMRALAEARNDEKHVVSRDAERRLVEAAREHPEAASEIDGVGVDRPSDGEPR